MVDQANPGGSYQGTGGEPPSAITRRRLRRARLGVGLAFLLTGAVYATWAARIPAFKQELGLSDGQLAIAFVGLNAGALAGLQIGGALVPRFGSRGVVQAALPLFALGLVPLALAGNVAVLTIVLFLSATVNSVLDVGMIAHGVVVEQRSGQLLLSRFHGMHPLGGMLGAGLAACAAWIGLSLFMHFLVVGLIACLAGLAAAAWLLPAATDAAGPRRQHRRRGALQEWVRDWPRPIVGLGALAFCVTFAEESIYNWAAVYLCGNLGAGADLAAIGVTGFLAGTTLGRLTGDYVIDRFGAGTAFRAGGLVGSVGLGASLLIGTPLAGITGMVVVGAGISYLLPLLLSVAGGSVAGSDVAPAVTRVSTLAYVGSFVSPILIGGVAGSFGLAAALAMPAGLVILAALFAGPVIPTTAVHGD